jgi:hypothetical protein
MSWGTSKSMAPDRGALNRAIAGLEFFGEHRAAHPPAQRAHHLPPAHPLGVRSDAADRLVAGEQLLARAEAAGRLVHLAETPRRDANPAEFLHRIAQVYGFPVEHADQALRADHDVAGAHVAVHDGQPGRRRRQVVAQPAERPLDHGPRRPIAPVAGVGGFQAGFGRADSQRAGRCDVHLMDVGGGGADLAGQLRPRVGVLRIAQDAPGDGLAAQPLHHVAAPEPVLRRADVDDLGGRRARAARKADQPRLGLHPSCALALNEASGIAAQDQRQALRAGLDVERPQLLAGAAREPFQTGQSRRRTEAPRDNPGKSALKLNLTIRRRHTGEQSTPTRLVEPIAEADPVGDRLARVVEQHVVHVVGGGPVPLVRHVAAP